MRFIIVIIIWLLIDFYCFNAFKTALQNTQNYSKVITLTLYWVVDLFLISSILYLNFSGKLENGGVKSFSLLFGLTVVSLSPKLIITPFLLIEDIVRIFIYSFQKITSILYLNQMEPTFIGRRKIVSQISIGLAVIPFLGLIYGIVRGKYDYRVHKVDVFFDDLPLEFDGFKITQLSDIHSGSFDNKEAVEKGVKLANDQNSDLIVFTGDLVNNKAEEMDEWIPTFSKLKAPFGQYSILGNHDYGDYVKWDSEEEKKNNLKRLKEVHKEIGFNLLLNTTVKVKKGNSSIALIGVENWGMRGFHQYGDLDKAISSIDQSEFKILLSHDPSHWEQKTLKHEKHVHLTLAGHTHGMQFGIEIPGFKWSPVKYIYKQWAGAYKKNGKYLYINRGFGFIGYPGRVGILPEVTVLTLKRTKTS